MRQGGAAGPGAAPGASCAPARMPAGQGPLSAGHAASPLRQERGPLQRRGAVPGEGQLRRRTGTAAADDNNKLLFCCCSAPLPLQRPQEKGFVGMFRIQLK